MATDYYGNNNNFPIKYKIPSDGDKPTASSVNVALEALGDRTAYLSYQLDAAFDQIHDVEADVTANYTALNNAIITTNTAIGDLKFFDSAYYRLIETSVAQEAAVTIASGAPTLLDEGQVSLGMAIGDLAVIDWSFDVFGNYDGDVAQDITFLGASKLDDVIKDLAGAKSFFSFPGLSAIGSGLDMQYPRYRVAMHALFVAMAVGTYFFGLKAGRSSDITTQIGNYSIRALQFGKRLAS